MRKGVVPFIFLVFLLRSFPLTAFTIPGIPHIPSTPPPLAESGVWFQTINDSFGSVWADEWDDLRSFGFHGGVKLKGKFLFSCGYDGLTFRGEQVSGGLRTDTFSFSAGWEFAHLRTDLIALSAAAGVGSTVWGNLGGYTIQYTWHEAIDVLRPIPEAYDSKTFFHPFAYGRLTVVLLLPVAVEFSLYGTAHTSADITAAADVLFWLLQRDFALYTGTQLRMSTDYRFSPTVEEVRAQEQGVWLRSGLTAGIISLENNYNLSTGISTGSIGLSVIRPHLFSPDARPYPPPKLPPQRITAEIGFPLGGNYSIYRLTWQPASFFREGPLAKRLSFFLTYENGWAQKEAAEESEEKVRFQQFTTGCLFSSSPPRFGTLFSLFLRTGLGWHEEKNYIADVTRAEPFATMYRAVHTGGIGVTFRFHPPWAGSRTAHYGFSISGNYRLPLFTAAAEYAEKRGRPLEPELFFSLSMAIATVPP
jgi:hypothetical protein